MQIFSGQMRWADIAARTLDPPVAQHNSEWRVLEVLMHWPWDRFVLSRAGMGVVQARALGISLAMSVARGRAPLEVTCNGTIHTERLTSGALNNAGAHTYRTYTATHECARIHSPCLYTCVPCNVQHHARWCRRRVKRLRKRRAMSRRRRAGRR